MAEVSCTKVDGASAIETAWFAAQSVMSQLGKALKRGQHFRVTVSGGDVEDAPVRGKDGQLYATGHMDGSVKIVIEIDPPKVCPKCGKNHGLPQGV